MKQPIITQSKYIAYSKQLISELKSLYKQIFIDTIKLTIQAKRESWSLNKYENEIVKLFEDDPEQKEDHSLHLEKATIKRPPSKAMEWASLKGKYGWTGKRYGSLIKKILVENKKVIATSILEQDKKRFEKNLRDLLPKTEKQKVIRMPDISNVIRKSNVIIKAADNGELMNQSRREDMRKILKDVILSKKVDTTKGVVNNSIVKEVESKFKDYFENYTKNSPPYGVPKNLHNIAVTETRSLLNNVRHEYMSKVNDTAKQEGFEMFKTWIHNNSLSKQPRSNHGVLDGVMLPMDAQFHLVGSKDKKHYYIDSPHDYSLPPEEVITCNCDVVYRMKKRRKSII